mgnify:CR=1 FL=1
MSNVIFLVCFSLAYGVYQGFISWDVIRWISVGAVLLITLGMSIDE